MTNEAVTGSDQLLASIKEKDVRIKEIEALRQHIFDYSKTRKIFLEYKRLPKAKKAEFYELHRAEIELQEAARVAFNLLPTGTKLPPCEGTERRTDQTDSGAAGRICGVPEGQDRSYGIHPGKAECGCHFEQTGDRQRRKRAIIVNYLLSGKVNAGENPIKRGTPASFFQLSEMDL